VTWMHARLLPLPVRMCMQHKRQSMKTVANAKPSGAVDLPAAIGADMHGGIHGSPKHHAWFTPQRQAGQTMMKPPKAVELVHLDEFSPHLGGDPSS